GSRILRCHSGAQRAERQRGAGTTQHAHARSAGADAEEILRITMTNGVIRILGIPGSLRRFSYNKWALRAAQQLAPEDATIEIVELDGTPPFNEDEEHQPPPAVVDLKARLGGADAVLFATPEYNYSIPGVLKNAIDWASRPNGQSAWAGKP